MSGFSLDWLQLREPFDRAARNARVRGAALAALSGKGDVVIADLASGAGSTMRALSGAIEARQSWRLFDHDGALLAAAMDLAPAVAVETRAIDLADALESVVAADVSMMTTSALLDLVSQNWIERLARTLVRARLPFYAALTYDGRVTLDPVDPLDATIVALANRHQRGDKGFGPALGPAAAPAAIDALRSLGFDVVSGLSDWRAGPDDRAFQAELVQGWAGAAHEMKQLSPDEIDRWLGRRCNWIACGRSSLTVGHIDFFATRGA